MKVPLSWLADFVEIEHEPIELARRLTFAGLEVEGIVYVGRALPPESERRLAPVTGLAWDPERVVVGYVTAVETHPNADKLVVARVDVGAEILASVTGAPNLLALRGQALERPLPVAVAKEGARIRDAYTPGWPETTIERAELRGVESTAMVCSEGELGISDEHVEALIFDDDAPAAGTPLADYVGDVVLDISITPNMARNASVIGVAREIAALTGKPLTTPDLSVTAEGPPIDGRIDVDIRSPELNPRFTATLLEGVTIGPSPYWMRRRLRLAGMRPVSNVVDVTNWVMLELGQPLHAFDYDVLVERAGGEAPTLVTRLPEPGERLTTLDDIDRELDDFTILVADGAGALSLGGVMGGEESEVSETTTRVLLEAAAWNFINIRRTVQAQQLSSEAGYRFSRGVHPELAIAGNLRGIELMRRLAGGAVAEGVVDRYPQPAPKVVVELPLAEIERLLGIEIPRAEVVGILSALEFEVEERGDTLDVTVPEHRLDIGTGVVGRADLVEEIARIYGYEKIPETQISDTIPPQRGNPSLDTEERVRDLLVELGLQEVVAYRLTSPEREARLVPGGDAAETPAYVRMANPISEERVVMRRSLLGSLLEAVQENARFEARLRLFEIGPVYLPVEGEQLPAEPRRLAVAMTGPRDRPGWQGESDGEIDFYDLKGAVDALLSALHVGEPVCRPARHPSFHPGRTAVVEVAGEEIGVLGELHPEVHEAFALSGSPVLAAELDLETLLAAVPERYATRPVPRFPALVEDLAIVVDEAVPAADVERVLRDAGGPRLAELELFDLYRGEQLGEAKKSLAYRLTLRSDEGTLTDEDAAAIRARIVERLAAELDAELRA